MSQLSTQLKGLFPQINDWIIILANVLFFMLVQTYFFKYIAAQQYEYVLETKLQTFKTLAKYNPEFAYALQHVKQESLKKLEQVAAQQRKQREEINNELEFTYCWQPIIVVSSVIALLVISLYLKKQAWTKVDSANLLFVVLAYSTELFIFFFIIRKYVFIGDINLWTRALQKQLENACANFNDEEWFKQLLKNQV